MLAGSGGGGRTTTGRGGGANYLAGGNEAAAGRCRIADQDEWWGMALSADAVQLLWDKQELHDLVVRVARAIDRCDDELLLSCYWDDAWDDHGTYKGGPAGFLAHLKRKTMVPSNGPIQHSISNILLDVRGDVAHGESYGESRSVGEDGSVARGLCRYVDRFERRNGEWRIACRRVILESARSGFDVSDFVAGSRTREDPSYQRESARS